MSTVEVPRSITRFFALALHFACS